MNPAHLALLRSLPCILSQPWACHSHIPVCGGSTEAHHSTHGRGMAQKTDDSRAFPLCQKHHREFHSLSGHFKGWTKEQIHKWQDEMSERYKPAEEIF